MRFKQDINQQNPKKVIMGSSHITWNEWNNIPNLFLDLRTEEDFFDVTLAIDEDNQFPAHKVILSAASPFFRGLLKRNPSQHPSIYPCTTTSSSAVPKFNISQFPLCSNVLIPGHLQAALSLKGKAGRLRFDSLNYNLTE